MEDIAFRAEIVERGNKNGKKYVVLNETRFYPDGKGGQIGDRGKIGSSNVIEVIEDNGKILHFVDDFPIDDPVLCVIDGNRRQDASIQHTAQHILSQAFSKLYNYETISFHMGESASTIDLNCTSLTADQIESCELLSNKIVLEDRLVNKFFVAREELEKYNLRKKEEIEGSIRIVKVEDFDVSMCGGTHVDRTGEIGLIKIIKVEKQKKDFTRVFFVAGLRSLKDYSNKVKLTKELESFLTTGEEEILDKVKKTEAEVKFLRKEMLRKENELLDLNAKIIAEKEVSEGNYLIKQFNDIDKNALFAIAKKFIASYDFSFFISCESESTNAVICLKEKPHDILQNIKSEIILVTNGKAWDFAINTIALIFREDYYKQVSEIFLRYVL